MTRGAESRQQQRLNGCAHPISSSPMLRNVGLTKQQGNDEYPEASTNRTGTRCFELPIHPLDCKQSIAGTAA
jgi:hypothetical protein